MARGPMVFLCLLNELRQGSLCFRVVQSVADCLPTGVEIRVVDLSELDDLRSPVALPGERIPDEMLSVRAELYAADYGLIVRNLSMRDGRKNIVKAVEWLALPPISPLRVTPIAVVDVGPGGRLANPISAVLGYLGTRQPRSSPLHVLDPSTEESRTSIQHLTSDLLQTKQAVPQSRWLVVSNDGERGSRAAGRVFGVGWARVEMATYEQALDRVLPGAFDVVILAGADSATHELEERLRRVDPYLLVVECG